MLFVDTVAVLCENHTKHTDTVCGQHVEIWCVKSGGIYSNLWALKCKLVLRTSQETHYISATKPNRLMLFGETVAVYCEDHTEHTDTLCGQNASK
jgi:hypothetical protein